MDNKLLLDQLLSHLHPERENTKRVDREAYTLLDLFIRQNEQTDITELIYNLTLDSSEIKKISALLDLLIWLAPDNGNLVAIATHRWFAGDVERKIEIVLCRSDDYPIHPVEKLKDRLQVIITKFPKLADLCNFWLVKIENQG